MGGGDQGVWREAGLGRILPRDSGEGDRALARWKGEGLTITQASQVLSTIAPIVSSSNDNEAPTQTPPPPRFAWSPPR